MSFHGGNIVATAKSLGCQVSDLIDMSSNLTPLGAVPGLHEAIIEGLDEIAYLPETASETLTEAFSEKFNIKTSQIIAGNGTTEFIFALPALFAGKKAVIVNPTYSDYRLSCQWQNIDAQSFTLLYEQDFKLNFEDLSRTLSGWELVFICNPNNPTGALISSETLLDVIRENPQSTFLVDESYLPFTREKSLLHYEFPNNLYLLCSFSKIYGIPGLRLGFLVSSDNNINKLNKRIKPWGVNRIAQISGKFLLLNADPYVDTVVSYLEQQRPEFVDRLNNIKGVDVVPGDANFILSHLQGEVSVAELQDKMLEKRIMIRNCNTFEGLDDHFFRLSLKDEKANNYCLDCLQEILGVK
jgi:threonine-phosphate decarboxylase